MLTVFSGKHDTFCDGLSRRGFLRAGFLGLGGLGLADVLKLRAEAARQESSQRKTAVIFIEMAGGPSQFETYDPKPDGPAEYRGPFGAVRTNVPGVIFCELMREQAKIADKLSIIRSVHHTNNSHDPSSHFTQTGYYKRGQKGSANEMPSFGSIAAKIRGANDPAVPAYVGIPRIMRNGDAAYLGRTYRPFETAGHYIYPEDSDKPEELKEGGPDDPNSPDFEINNLTLSAGLSMERLVDRRALLSALDHPRRLLDLGGSSLALDRFTAQAFDLVSGPAARRAFDIHSEDSRVRDAYGRTNMGQSMLLARRLVEHGVTCVTVCCLGWDHHRQLPEAIRKCAPDYDRAIAALVADLYERGLDKDVLVVAMGEFGRTPRFNENNGRDHWAAVSSVLLACGGLQPGVLGASDAHGAVPVESPYGPENVLAMLYRHLGINPSQTFADGAGRPRHILEHRELIPELI